MKKLLFGTTALLAAGAFVSTAQASDPIKLSLGGYMEYWGAAASQDGDFNKTNRVNNFDIQGEGEVWFMGKTTLDNGLTIEVRVELENGSNNNGNDIIDEVYMTLSGKYGQAIIGSTNDVAYKSQVDAPEASYIGGAYPSSESDTIQYLLIPGQNGTSVNTGSGVKGTNTGVDLLDVKMNVLSDQNKISYYTPILYGFQGGVSYIPSNNSGGDDTTDAVKGGTWGTNTNSEGINKAATFDDAWAFSLTYNNTFSGVGVKATTGYIMIDDSALSGAGVAHVHNQDTLVQEFAAGLNLTYKGFTLGGGAKRRIANVDTSMAATDGYAWDLGVMYAEGPYAVSFNYSKSSVVGDRATAGNDKVDEYRIGGSYTLGPGVILFSQLAYLDAKDESGIATAGNEGAYGGVVGLRLNF